MADSNFGVCYIWFISSLLFIFTVSGAVFLVLFMMQPGSPTTSSYPIIGVSLVCFPWFFWLLTILYRLISRACGFRMSCFGSNGVDHSNNNNNYNIYNNNNIPSGGRTSNNNGGYGGSPINNASLASINVNEGGDNLVNENGNRNEHGNGNGNENENRASLVGTPRRVHFGGVVVLGEDDGGANENQGRSESLPSPSSSSSNNGDESEMPLKFSMA